MHVISSFSSVRSPGNASPFPQAHDARLFRSLRGHRLSIQRRVSLRCPAGIPAVPCGYRRGRRALHALCDHRAAASSRSGRTVFMAAARPIAAHPAYAENRSVCAGLSSGLECAARSRRLDPPLCGLCRLPTPQALQYLRCRHICRNRTFRREAGIHVPHGRRLHRSAACGLRCLSAATVNCQKSSSGNIAGGAFSWEALNKSALLLYSLSRSNR